MQRQLPRLESIWLHNNPRVRFIVIVLTLAGLGILAIGLANHGLPWLRVVLGSIGCFGLLMASILEMMNFGARIAYASDQLRIRFGILRPFTLPLDVVEAFFPGEELLPTAATTGREIPTANVIIRLAERAVDWHRREIPAALGRWCGGYVVVRGLWCQPITPDLLRDLNERLIQAKRNAARQTAMEPSSSGVPDQ